MTQEAQTEDFVQCWMKHAERNVAIDGGGTRPKLVLARKPKELARLKAEGWEPASDEDIDAYSDPQEG